MVRNIIKGLIKTVIDEFNPNATKVDAYVDGDEGDIIMDHVNYLFDELSTSEASSGMVLALEDGRVMIIASSYLEAVHLLKIQEPVDFLGEHDFYGDELPEC